MEDIANLSMVMAQANVQQQASISVMKKAMDSTNSEIQAIKEMMPPSSNVLDTYA